MRTGALPCPPAQRLPRQTRLMAVPMPLHRVLAKLFRQPCLIRFRRPIKGRPRPYWPRDEPNTKVPSSQLRAREARGSGSGGICPRRRGRAPMRRPFRLKPESEEVEKVSSRRRPQCAVPSAAYGAGPEAEALPLAPNAADASAPAPDGASERGAPSGEVWCLLHRVQLRRQGQPSSGERYRPELGCAGCRGGEGDLSVPRVIWRSLASCALCGECGERPRGDRGEEAQAGRGTACSADEAGDGPSLRAVSAALAASYLAFDSYIPPRPRCWWAVEAAQSTAAVFRAGIAWPCPRCW